MKTQDARSLPPVAQEDLRRKAVRAVLAGRTQLDVAQMLGVTRQSVGRWVKAHREGGARALKARKRGRPKGKALEPWQAAQTCRAILDRRPEQLKLPFYLWTRQAVGQLIAERFGVRLSVWTVGRYLKSWGFTAQKPLRRAFEQDPQAVRRWLEDDYPAIRTQAKRERAGLYWGDEMGLRSDHQTGTSYGRRGHTPVIAATGQRFGCNMISAITNRGQLSFMVFKKRFSADVFIDFLRRLVRQSTRKVFLIVDRHPVHRSAKAKKWLRKHDKSIALFFLPPYSPELNPDEVLNQDVKSNAVGRRRPHDQKQMLASVRGYLRGRQRRPHLVRKYFDEEHVRYATR